MLEEQAAAQPGSIWTHFKDHIWQLKHRKMLVFEGRVSVTQDQNLCFTVLYI